ncbi:Cysteine proteinase inhibitor [Rhynchospora pubera]|uniref:Cysteine proteinase inhibitor n=1 Tax=Rhynchospora pubera TaxID=906938 RepID=A0AAV8FIY9_9POAL|nr:Cysteine proteinase inhibitor [Rhynchospora pubera]KAJ4790996.1 Cysteine proteinase inhibitor [Rhynchospora pubera]KAJ4814826.1 Cysteine proteinase inhibitor [Rhynchospora pubera]
MYLHYSHPFFLLLSTICLLTFVAAAPSPASTPVVGGRTLVPHVESNKEIQSLGRFSVAQYNYHLRNGSNGTATPHARPLAFSRVVEAETQVVSGVKYYLKVIAKDGKYSTNEKLFDAVVVVKPWLKSKELVSFTPSPK